jgi:valyl-tRNA synthetase
MDPSKHTLVDEWIISRLHEVIKEADYNYEKYEFGEASRALYNFIWDEFASWYVEFAKVSLQQESLRKNTQAVLLYVLRAVLKMMHPFIPFVTEKLFLEISKEPSIMISSWPEAGSINIDAIETFKEVMDAITKVRNLRSESNVAPSKPLDIHLVIEDTKMFNNMLCQEDYFIKFMNAKELKIETALSATEETILMVGKYIQTYVLKKDIIDPEREKETLLKQKQVLENEIKRSENILNNPNFVQKAPKEKLDNEKEKYQSYLKQYDMVMEKLKNYV